MKKQNINKTVIPSIDKKYTVICTVNEKNENFNFQVNGWLNENECEKLVKKFRKNNLFTDYICGFEHESISCKIHARYNVQ